MDAYDSEGEYELQDTPEHERRMQVSDPIFNRLQINSQADPTSRPSACPEVVYCHQSQPSCSTNVEWRS